MEAKSNEARRRLELERMTADQLDEALLLATGGLSANADVGKLVSQVRKEKIERILQAEFGKLNG
jgi:hypothetical protein